MFQKMYKYFSKHPAYTSFVHAIGGIGIGILIASPVAGVHPIRWGLLFIAVAIILHTYPLWAKK